VARFCEHGDEYMVSIKCGEFIDKEASSMTVLRQVSYVYVEWKGGG